MSEKRYSDGTLAKWYYSQTNVISDGENEYYLRNKKSVKDLDYNELLGTNDLLDELNRLSDENENLKEDVERCRNNFSVLDEVKCEIAEENEKLKQQRDFYYERLQKIIKVANGDLE